MEKQTVILGKNHYYSLDCFQTQLNNNVLVVGASGAGKTRSIVTPNLLQATGSYLVSDPKGNLYKKYKGYLKQQGYVVKKLDFTNPTMSSHYNFFRYIHNTQDILRISHMLVASEKYGSKDPFWDDASQLLLQSVIAYILEFCQEKEQNLHVLLKLINLCQEGGNMEDSKTTLDRIMEHALENDEESFAYQTYLKFRVAANRTLRSILVTTNAKLGLYDTPEVNQMTACDDIDIPMLGQRKTAIFVVVSDTDRSMDRLVNIFFTQAMQELCRYADTQCRDNMLPVPVRFILDDFATNCKIDDFPRMISSIRSRGLSAMLMIQAEAQLTEGYGNNGKTIIANCDTYVYMGGNDVETAKAVAERCDIPPQKILNMPVGTNWIFRRGQAPVCGENFDLDELLQELEAQKERGREE